MSATGEHRMSAVSRTRPKPIRVLHVLGGMTWGGVETWLLHVLRHIDHERFQVDLLVHTTEPCAHDDEARALGGTIIPCIRPARPRLYAHNFERVMRERGPYDVVHSHVHHYSGYVLRLAWQAGVPVRIAHSHNDTARREASAGLLRRRYLRLMERWIDRYATAGLAASEPAALDLFGPGWRTDRRWSVLHCGLDLASFRATVDPAVVRAELGIPVDAFVVGHVGRFVEQKNHEFLLDIVGELIAREPKTYALLIGDRPLLPEIERRAARMGLGSRIIFACARYDVPRLIQGAMDTFVLPSLFEGLGLVLVEAQTLGLACILSDVVPEEADVVGLLTHRLALAAPATVWATAILDAHASAATITRRAALALVEKSSFNIHASIRQLERMYGN